MEEYRDHEGNVRMLARNLPTEDTLKKRAAKMTFTQYLEKTGGGLIPRSQWKSFGRRKSMGTEFVLNQGQFGACVGFSAACALMRLRVLRGQTFQRLSGAYVYAHVNGGHDNGAIITDAMDVLAQHGTCLESEMNIPKIYLKQIPAGADKTAERFIEEGDITIETFDEMGTAIMMDGIVQGPIMVGDNFEHFTGDGVAGFDRGEGNHSVHFYDVEQIPSGEWVLLMGNTWDIPWGPFKQGCVLISEKAIAGCASGKDAFVHFAAKVDPQDANKPPLVTA